MGGVGVIQRLLALLVSAPLRCRNAIAVCIGFEGLTIALSILGPLALKVLVDHLSNQLLSAVSLLGLVVFFVVAWTAATPLTAVRGVYSSRIATRLAKALSSGAVAGHLSGSHWRETDSGRAQGLLERLPYSLGIVLEGLVWRAVPLVLQLGLSLVVIGQMMGGGYVVGFLTLAVVFVWVSWLGFKRQVLAARAHNENLAQSSQRLGDVLKNARRVVSNGAIGFEVNGIEETFALRERSEAIVNWTLSRLSGMQWLAMAGGLCVVLAMGGADVMRGRITPGDFVLLQAYAIRLSLPLSSVAFFLSQSAGALSTLSDVMGLQGAVPPPAIFSQGIPVRVSVAGMSFSYGEGQAGLEDISVEFPAGSFSVIVGANGSGKSTLAQLIAGQLKPQRGFVALGDEVMNPTVADQWVGRVLYVPQRTTLFNRTLRSNLFYPPSRLREPEARARLQAWAFQDDARPIDLDVLVGEGGSALSGGQVQKVELVRLLRVNPDCLILDEATSALDPVSEAQIMSDLRSALGATTTLILVSHRVEVVARADQVVWIAGGRVAAVGTHASLMENQDYRRFWRPDVRGRVL